MTFTVPLEDVTVNAAETVTLTCELSKPDQKVKWLKNGKALTMKEKNRVKITAVGTKHTLVISKSEVEDTAQYSCSVNDVKTESKVVVKGITAFAIVHISHCCVRLSSLTSWHFFVFAVW